jgi:hypothetical protein
MTAVQTYEQWRDKLKSDIANKRNGVEFGKWIFKLNEVQRKKKKKMSTTRKIRRSVIRNADKRGFIRQWISLKRFNILYVISIAVLLVLIAVFALGCADNKAIEELNLLRIKKPLPVEVFREHATRIIVLEDNGEIRKYGIVCRLGAEDYGAWFITCDQGDTVLSIWHK